MEDFIPQNRSKMILRVAVLAVILIGLSWFFWLGPLADKHELKAEFVRYALPLLALWILIWGGWVIVAKLPIIKADENGIWLHQMFKQPRQVPWSEFTHMTVGSRKRSIPSPKKRDLTSRQAFLPGYF